MLERGAGAVFVIVLSACSSGPIAQPVSLPPPLASGECPSEWARVDQARYEGGGSIVSLDRGRFALMLPNPDYRWTGAVSRGSSEPSEWHVFDSCGHDQAPRGLPPAALLIDEDRVLRAALVAEWFVEWAGVPIPAEFTAKGYALFRLAGDVRNVLSVTSEQAPPDEIAFAWSGLLRAPSGRDSAPSLTREDPDSRRRWRLQFSPEVVHVESLAAATSRAFVLVELRLPEGGYPLGLIAVDREGAAGPTIRIGESTARHRFDVAGAFGTLARELDDSLVVTRFGPAGEEVWTKVVVAGVRAFGRLALGSAPGGRSVVGFATTDSRFEVCGQTQRSGTPGPTRSYVIGIEPDGSCGFVIAIAPDETPSSVGAVAMPTDEAVAVTWNEPYGHRGDDRDPTEWLVHTESRRWASLVETSRQATR